MGSKCCQVCGGQFCKNFWSCSCCSREMVMAACNKMKQFVFHVVKDPLFKPMGLLYVLTFFLVLPLLCHDWRFSVYYFRGKNRSAAQESARHENSFRYIQAKKYLDMLDRSQLHSALDRLEGNDSHVDIAMSVVTVSRNRHKLDAYEPHYLTQVVWKLLSLLHDAQSKGLHHTVKLFICNVDFDPQSYYEARKLAKIVPVHSRYGQPHTWTGNMLEKEKQDYVYCMNKSLALDPRYVLLIEDDALPYEDFFTSLEYVLDQHLDQKFHRGSIEKHPAPVSWVKLYHPERLLNFFSPEPDRIPELLGIGAFFGTLTMMVFSCIPSSMLKMLQINNKNVFKIWILWVLYFILVALAVGRANLIELRRLFSPYLTSYVRAPGCCTPAMLFSKVGAQQVSSYLSNIKCKTGFGKDMALEQFRYSHNLPAYMIQPNTVKHIGMYSSLRKAVLDPFIV